MMVSGRLHRLKKPLGAHAEIKYMLEFVSLISLLNSVTIVLCCLPVGMEIFQYFNNWYISVYLLNTLLYMY